jgi:hypothetical protein
LIILGLFAAVAASAIYPLMFLFYGQVASSFVDLQKYKLNQTLNSINKTTTNNPISNRAGNITANKW